MKKILLLEDEIIIAKDIEIFLSSIGFKVNITLSYNDAVKFLKKNTVDLVLIDIFLNDDYNGIDFANFLNDNFNIPFIFLTGNSDTATIESAKKTRPHGFITKPVNTIALNSTIEIVLANFELQQEIAHSKTLLSNLIDSIPESLFLINNSGEILEVNSESSKRLNIPHDQLLGKDFFSLYKKHKKEISSVKKTKLPISFEDCSNNNYYNYQVYPIFENSNINNISIFIQDITLQKNAEKDREIIHNEIDTILNLTPISLCIINEDCRIIRYNNTFQKYFLCDQSESDFLCKIILKNPKCDTDKCPLATIDISEEEFQITQNIRNEEKRFLVNNTKFKSHNPEYNNCILMSLTDITEYDRLIKIASNAIEHERRIIGQQLHDGVGQKLTGISYLFGSLKNLLLENFPEKSDFIDLFSQNLQESISLIRNISKGLWPINIKQQGFSNSILELVDYLKNIYGCQIKMKFVKPVEFEDMFVANNLYFILQEILLNAIKHSDSEFIYFAVSKEENQIKFIISNDIKGNSKSSTIISGIGNYIIQYRANLINAEIIKNITNTIYKITVQINI